MVEYFEMPELPGRKMFRCEKLRATLQATACAAKWEQANAQGAEHFGPCRNCQLGAKHSGVADVSLSPLRGMSICARCHEGTTRLINKHLCISCYNREREYRIGRNGRGTVPIKHPPLHNVEVRYQAGGEVVKASRDVVAVDEMIVAVLRDSGKQVTFGFATRRPKLPQQELFG